MAGLTHESKGNFSEVNGTDRVVINVGGTKHECYISTIQNFPDTRLYWIAEVALNTAGFEATKNEFFFDRHPGCFLNIMNYCRTGKLHCPNDVCGPLFEQELNFWGVDELMMEPCCWGNYTQHREAHNNLKMFDANDCDEIEEDEHEKKSYRIGVWQQFVNTARPKIWDTLEKPFSTRYAQLVAFISMLVIIVSIATFCLQTVPQFNKQKPLFDYLEYIYCGIFTFEFVMRLACCPSYGRFFTSVLTYIDLVSTMQFYIPYFVKTHSLDFLFVSRLIRIFRLFRFFKQLSGMQVIAQTLKASMKELMLLSLLLMIPMIIFSTLLYYAEKNSPVASLDSIPEYFWWSIVTLTTVGYGDVVPLSGYGKIIGGMCACSGVLIVALPVSVIGSNFTLYYSYAQARMNLPKKKRPMLMSVAKALVNSHHGSRTSIYQQSWEGKLDKGMKSARFKSFTTAMVDLKVPKRTRRDAIQPFNDHKSSLLPVDSSGCETLRYKRLDGDVIHDNDSDDGFLKQRNNRTSSLPSRPNTPTCVNNLISCSGKESKTENKRNFKSSPYLVKRI